MSAGEESRESAEGFGKAVEDVFGDAGDAIDALQGESNDPPPEKAPTGDGDININIER
jgi:hypothetical protein